MKRIFFWCITTSLLVTTACGGKKSGCMDQNAPNYDDGAAVDDGSCQFPPAQRKALLVLANSTSLESCGTFAIPLFNTAVQQNAAALPVVIHSSQSDPLFSSPSVDVAAAYGSMAIPDIMAGNTAGVLNQQAISDAIAAYMTGPVIANVDVIRINSADSVELVAYGKFFEPDTGQFFVTAWLLENQVTQAQAGISDPSFKHSYVLRGAIFGGIGYGILDGPVEAGTSFKVQGKIKLEPSWNTANLTTIGVIWRKKSGVFTVINAND